MGPLAFLSATAIASALALLVFLGGLALAERMHDGPRRALLTLLGVVLGAVAHELARYDQGLGVVLAFGAMVFAPLLVIFGGAAWAVRRFHGWPDLGDGPPRAAYVGLFVLAGMLLGTHQQARDVEASQRLADEVAFDTSRPASQLPRTRLGWWDPPRLRRGRDAQGHLVVAFRLSGAVDTVWRYRVAGSPTWQVATGAPPLEAFEADAP